MLGDADLAAGNALVETSVVGVDRCDVQIGNHVTVDRNVLSDLVAFAVGDLFAIEFPGNFGCRIAAGNALQKDRWTRVECLFGKCLSNDGRIDCDTKDAV